MTPRHRAFVTCRLVRATGLLAAALVVAGCIAPTTVTNLEGDSTDPAKRPGSKLAPATISASEAVDLAEPVSPPAPVPPVVNKPVVAVPLPLAEDRNDRYRAMPVFAPVESPENLQRAQVPLHDAKHWAQPQPTGLHVVPLTTVSEVSRLPAVGEPQPAPPQPLASPYLGPPIEPYTPAWMPPPSQSYSPAQVEPVPPPRTLPPNPSATFVPATVLPVQPTYTFSAPTQPPGAEVIQPGGQLSSIQRIKPIQQISLNIAAPAVYDNTGTAMQLPQNHAAEVLPQLAEQRPFIRNDLVDYGLDWQPQPEGLEFCYQPLYFEEVNLERYGRSWGILQPAVSAVKFYNRIPLLPYYVFARPARRCTYHPHWALPGYRIPCREPHQFHASAIGATAEVGAVFCMLALFP